MISRLTGQLVTIEQQNALVDVNGIVYEVECPISTLCELPQFGNSVTLFTHFVVREDAQLLYGFLRLEDRESFRILIKISGVGPKLAISILSGISGDELARAVEGKDTTALIRIPGVGKKTAERLLVELRGRFSPSTTLSGTSVNSVMEEVVLGLMALGYKENIARKTVGEISAEPDSTPEILIRKSLRQMLRK